MNNQKLALSVHALINDPEFQAAIPDMISAAKAAIELETMKQTSDLGADDLSVNSLKEATYRLADTNAFNKNVLAFLTAVTNNDDKEALKVALDLVEAGHAGLFQ